MGTLRYFNGYLRPLICQNCIRQWIKEISPRTTNKYKSFRHCLVKMGPVDWERLIYPSTTNSFMWVRDASHLWEGGGSCCCWAACATAAATSCAFALSLAGAFAICLAAAILAAAMLAAAACWTAAVCWTARSPWRMKYCCLFLSAWTCCNSCVGSVCPAWKEKSKKFALLSGSRGSNASHTGFSPKEFDANHFALISFT